MKPKVGDFIHYPDIPTPTVYVQYKGIFDMQDLYESVADFFRHKKFKLYEVQQRHRRPSPFGAEILYQFRAERKVTEYYKWIVNISIETFDLHDIDVVLKNGSKKKMQKGRLWISLNGLVDMDYERLWEKSAFLAQLRGFYNKYIMKKEIEGVWWDELYYKVVLKLHALIQEKLKMESEGFEARHMGGVH